LTASCAIALAPATSKLHAAAKRASLITPSRRIAIIVSVGLIDLWRQSGAHEITLQNKINKKITI
jgi:hypothetical protein